MKKGLFLLGVLLLTIVPCLAEESQATLPEQTINNEQTYFSANLAKQPQENGSKQGINNHFTFFTINVLINGKVKEIAEPQSK